MVSRKMAEEAARVFGFDISAGLLDEQAVLAAYRAEVKRVHPDAGGSVEAFAAVDRAKHVLLRWLARSVAEEPTTQHGVITACPRCEGRGFLELTGRRFGASIRRQCPACQGNGELYDEKTKEGDRI